MPKLHRDAIGNFPGNIIYNDASLIHGCQNFNDDGKNGRCACPNIARIQLKLEEQARLPELTVSDRSHCQNSM